MSALPKPRMRSDPVFYATKRRPLISLESNLGPTHTGQENPITPSVMPIPTNTAAIGIRQDCGSSPVGTRPPKIDPAMIHAAKMPISRSHCIVLPGYLFWFLFYHVDAHIINPPEPLGSASYLRERLAIDKTKQRAAPESHPSFERNSAAPIIWSHLILSASRNAT